MSSSPHRPADGRAWIVFAASLLGVFCIGATPIAIPESPQVQSIKELRLLGGQVDWSPSENLIAYDAPGLDGHYQLHIMAPDGTGDRCLTCGHPCLTRVHHGAPAWHPSGRYIVFLAEKPNHPCISYEA